MMGGERTRGGAAACRARLVRALVLLWSVAPCATCSAASMGIAQGAEEVLYASDEGGQTPASMGIAHAGEEAPKVRVLILSGANNHDWVATTPVLKELFDRCDRFAVVDVLEDPSKVTAEMLAGCDVVVSNWSAWPTLTGHQWGAVAEKALIDFVRGGKGFVTFHAACATCNDWPEFQQLVALTWVLNQTAHGAYHTFKVVVEDADHPITQGMKDFYTTDELWHKMGQIIPGEIHPICRAVSAVEKGGSGQLEPMVIPTQFGNGRGLNIVLGHDARAMRNAAWRTLMLRGAEWAATGKVTVPIPAYWPGTPDIAAAMSVDVDAALKAVSTYVEGQSREAVAVLEQLVRASLAEPTGSQAGMPAPHSLAAKMAAMLSGDATRDIKALLCKRLSLLGGDAEVPALEALLSNDALGFEARFALERIPGLASLEALRNALPKTNGNLKAGIVQSLGELRDAESVPAIAALLGDGDKVIAGAAAMALGRIGGAKAAQALGDALAKAPTDVRPVLTDAYLECADRFITDGNGPAAAAICRKLIAAGEADAVRKAALRGLARADAPNAVPKIVESLPGDDLALQRMALQLIRELPRDADVSAIAKALPKLPPDLQPLVLTALGDRGDARCLDEVLHACQSDLEPVRVAALKALGTLGGASSVEVIVPHLAGGVEAEAEAARASLGVMKGTGVNEAMVAQIEKGDAALKVELLRVLAVRHAVETAPALERAAGDAASEVRVEAWKALRDLAAPERLAGLLDLLAKTGAEERAAAEQAIAATCKRDKDVSATAKAVLARVDPAPLELKVSLLHVLGDVAADAVLPNLLGLAKDATPEVRDAAVRAVSAWPAPSALEGMIALAGDTKDDVHRALLLQGAARLIGEMAGMTPDDAVKWFDAAMKVAARPEDKRALLGALGKHPCLEALERAKALVGQPEVAGEAVLAASQVASGLAASNPDEVKAAMREIVKADVSPEATQNAYAVLIAMAKPENLALSATATSPDGIESDGGAGGDAAANDGKLETYWDETNDQKEYRLRIEFAEPKEVSAIRIKGHAYQSYCPKDFDILCDDRAIKSVQNAEYTKAGVEFFTPIPKTTCKALELRITGYYGNSPGIRELEIYNVGLDE